MARLEDAFFEESWIECPRCVGARGWWDTTNPKAGKKGMWHPCITCKTQGVVKVASQAEVRRLIRSISKPQKVQTKQREKEK